MPVKNYTSIQKYIKANSSLCEIESSHQLNCNFSNLIVIPVFDELDFIHKTLTSLFQAVNNADAESLILVIINNPPRTSDNYITKAIENNQILLQQLRDNMFCKKEKYINLAWIDASSPGNEIRPDHGVGGARKKAIDAGLSYLEWNNTPLIFSLDADTLVEKNYLTASREHFETNPQISGAVIDFKHQKGKSPSEEKAIRIYEKFLQQYVDGLKNAKSPYAYHSVGSTMVFRAESYIKAGGMRPRTAGEDFYFLQALCKSGEPPTPIGEIKTTKVFPSARISPRVPFGTGPRIAEIIAVLEGKQQNGFYYNPEIFQILQKLISSVEGGSLERSMEDWFVNLPAPAKAFLNSCEFRKTWPKIIKNTPDDPMKIKWAFHTWFDAFRILKFIHFCESTPFNLKRINIYLNP